MQCHSHNTRYRDRIILDPTVINNPVTARSEAEAIKRLEAYILPYTYSTFYIGITSGSLDVTSSLKTRHRNHQPAKKHELYTMHCIYVSASNTLIRRFEERMIDRFFEYKNNVNKIKGSKKIEKNLSHKSNSYLYLLIP